MPTPIPNIGISRQLQKLGGLAKQAGTGLFAPTQAPGPMPAPATSMGAGALDASPAPIGISTWGGSGLGGLSIGTPGRLGAPILPGMGGTGTGPGGQPTYGGGGSMASLGGDWAGVDRWDATIQQAAAQYGVPANLIKAVMKLESGGDPNSVSVAGATGLMQIMPFWNGTAGYNIHDPTQNIMLGAYILKQNYDQYGASWEQAVRHYLGIGQDAYGTTDSMYWNRVSQDWNALNAASGGGTAGLGYNPGSGGTGNIGGMFGGGASVEGWGEFNVPSSNGLYAYGTSYGLNGSNHTGLDVAMPVGTQMFAPMSGVVTCAGTNNGSGADGGGCAAFGDTYGQGAGRIEVLLDNGTVLIYGHSSTAAVRPGQRVTAGTLLGTSGGMNFPHTHLEARVRDGSTGSGWRIVDPRTVLGGGMFTGGSSTGGTGYGGYGGTGSGGYQSLSQSIANFLQNWGR